jgi:hypothetical protein
MGKLPKNFPEYSIMYKTLFKKIKELEKENESNEIKLKIKNYRTELDKITKMFPDGFFDIEN